MSKTINYSAWPLKLWNVVCLLLLRIKYSLVGSCRYVGFMAKRSCVTQLVEVYV